jgi:DNA-binding GntR family transcriptional regulator
MTSAKKSPSKSRRDSGVARTDSRASLHDEVLTKLRDYIVENNFPNAARVPERELCEQFGISRTPLREALKVLAAEGLVELLPNRGARIRDLKGEELRELFDVMGGLESLAGRLACENITEAQVAEITDLHHKMYASYLHRDLHSYFEYNQKIHELILTAAANSKLTQAYRSLANQIRRKRFSANLSGRRDRWGEAVREHEEMLDALRRRAGDDLANILFKHLRNKLIAAQSETNNESGEEKEFELTELA